MNNFVLQAAGSFLKHQKARCNLHCVFRSVKRVAGEVIFGF
jgi:hypothetical protein